MEVILLTAYGTVSDGVRAMKLGAFDYLTKGDSSDQLVVVGNRAVEKARRRVVELHAERVKCRSGIACAQFGLASGYSNGRQCCPGG